MPGKVRPGRREGVAPLSSPALAFFPGRGGERFSSRKESRLCLAAEVKSGAGPGTPRREVLRSRRAAACLAQLSSLSPETNQGAAARPRGSCCRSERGPSQGAERSRAERCPAAECLVGRGGSRGAQSASFWARNASSRVNICRSSWGVPSPPSVHSLGRALDQVQSSLSFKNTSQTRVVGPEKHQ